MIQNDLAIPGQPSYGSGGAPINLGGELVAMAAGGAGGTGTGGGGAAIAGTGTCTTTWLD